jgi:hypothetical protein
MPLGITKPYSLWSVARKDFLVPEEYKYHVSHNLAQKGLR